MGNVQVEMGKKESPLHKVAVKLMTVSLLPVLESWVLQVHETLVAAMVVVAVGHQSLNQDTPAFSQLNCLGTCFV